MSDVKKRCAACRNEKPVSEMKVCMHSQMHYYVCDAKCMHDFYNPPKAEKTGHAAIIAALQSTLSAAEAERDQLRLEVKNRQHTIDGMNEAHWQLVQAHAQLRAELEAIRGQQVVGRVHHNEEHAEPVRAVLNSIGRQLPDNSPLYAMPPQQGVLYVSAESLADDGVVGMHATRKPNAVQNVALYAIPPQQPDTWPTLDKPAKVGAVLFNPGLSARLVVEAAQRQHEYSQQPEVEAARLERFGAFMREVHGENGDGGASDGP
ncbi:hypothetical protein [Metapseudomonas otitidis]|uniref:hypothetical protein n=1 Tax=Metapseudomonas otitidis TaxID=319939 RepID=UPI00244898CD|nr:hypothetical protein [Pseudomonas otitidis]MDG9784687.1 hypothetical protein [Pseudomonas otitidis]